MRLQHYTIDLRGLAPSDRAIAISLIKKASWTYDEVDGFGERMYDVFFPESVILSEADFPPGTVLLKLNG